MLPTSDRTPAEPPATSAISPPETRDCWSPLDDLIRGFPSGLFGPIEARLAEAFEGNGGGGFGPALLDVSDLGANFEITAELPGMAKDRIDVRVVGSTVQIVAEQTTAHEEKRRHYLRRERTWSGYRRSVELPEPVRSDDVRARYENGVLTVTVPKAHPTAETKVAVQ
jgi:HSP20 family protein